MEKRKVLFVSQEIVPYLRDSEMGSIGRKLPEGIQNLGKEIRTFMPRFGCINERRNSLHEVIRLSGMNIIIDDTDHPLIIKVASITSARMQVYFSDNDDYFNRKYILHDKDGNFFKDNDERAIFFIRGVAETVKKLGWAPDVIHLHGWMSAVMAPYIKKVFSKHPIFSDSKIVISIYDDHFQNNLSSNLVNKLQLDDLVASDFPNLTQEQTYIAWMKDAIYHSEGVIIGSPQIKDELVDYAKSLGLPVLPYQSEETYIQEFNKFYDLILVNEKTTC